MEDNQFWDELANRLRQQPEQPFREEDWATVHQRIRATGKRRAWWFWPLLAGLVLIGNNLLWYLLLPANLTTTTPALAVGQRDTVVLIRERVIRDTVWQKIPASLVEKAATLTQTPRIQPPAAALSQPVIKNTIVSESLPAFAKNDSTDHHIETPISPRIPTVALRPQQAAQAELLTPFSASLVPTRSGSPDAPKPVTNLLIAADGGGAAFLSKKLSHMHQWQAGVSLYALAGKWGGTLGIHRVHATENPAVTGPEIGWSPACPTCPGPSNFPDRVSLQWTAFQVGVAHRVTLPNRKTEFLLSLTGQLRSQVKQYRHFVFENYGGPRIEIEDWYREDAGLYWNGWNGSVSVVHRIAGKLGVSGTLEGQWPGGVRPDFLPASMGLRAGIVWYARE